jgi:aspartate aminotransferase
MIPEPTFESRYDAQMLVISCLFMNLISMVYLIRKHFANKTVLLMSYLSMYVQKISAYTGEKNTYFEMFILTHVKISRAITILILVAQVTLTQKA